MIIMDYHLLFIAFTLVILILTVLIMFFMEPEKEGIFGVLILCAINWLMSLISLLGFFGIYIPYYSPTTDQVGLELIQETWGLFAYFFLIFYMNIIFIYYAAIKWMKLAMDIKEESI